MRFEQIDLIAYGNFTNKTLKFTDPSKTVHVIYGPNEAGKSTLKNAIEELLFGYHARTPFDFKHPYNMMALGATLVSAAGERVSFHRRKKKSGSDLFTATNESMPASALAPYVGSLTRETYQEQFCLSRESLMAGSLAIANGSGEVGESLYNAVTGKTNVPEIVAKLERLSAEIFLPNAQKPKLNTAIRVFEEQRKIARDALVRPDQWQRHEDERDELASKVAEIVNRIGAAAALKMLLTALLACAPNYEKLRISRAALNEAAGEPRMEPQAFRAAALLIAKLDEAETEVVRGEQRLARIVESIGPEDPDPLLGQRSRIETLFSGVERYRKNVFDLADKGLHEHARINAMQARAHLDLVWPGLDLDEARTRNVPFDAQNRGNALSLELVRLTEQYRRSEATEIDLRDQIDATAGSLAGLPETRNVDAVRGAVAAAEAQPRLDADIDEARRSVDQLTNTATAALEKLGRFSGSVMELLGLTLPLPATIERHFDALEALRGGKERRIERMAVARLEHADAGEQLDAMAREHEIRTLHDLVTAREDRDGRFDTLAGRWRAGALAPELDALADDYRPAVLAADGIADTLRNDAVRVALVARLEAKRDSSRADMDRLTAELAGLDDEMSTALAAWQAEWTALGISALSPSEMREWLNRANEVRRIAGESQTSAALERDKLVDRRIALRADLVAALEQLAIECPRGDTIDPMLGLAQHMLKEHDGLKANRERLTTEKTRIEGERLKESRNFERTQSKLNDTTSDFHGILERLSLPKDLAEGALPEMLTSIASFHEFDKRATFDAARAKGLDRDVSAYQAEVQAFVNDYAPNLLALAKTSPDAAVEQLHDRLVTVQEAFAKRNARIEQRDAEAATLNEEIDKRSVLLGELDAILARESIVREALAGRIDRSNVLNDHMCIVAAETEHIQLGTGKTLDECDVEYGDRDREMLQHALSVADSEIDALTADRDRLNPKLWEVKEELRRLDSSSAAADAEARLAALATAVDQGARRYLELTLAAYVLKEQIRKYSEGNQGAVISRASHYLSVLTDGKYGKLRAAADGDRNVLEAVNADGAGLEIAALSEGTRDQLFIALRLAAFEMYLEQGEPQPLILDDTFVACDDARTVLAFTALAEIAGRTQVLYFTHHAACVEAARAGIGADRLAIHNLHDIVADGLTPATV